MTHAEYLEWRAFDQNEPLGATRDDLHTAMMMTLLANIHKGKGKKGPKLTDFLPDWWKDSQRPAALAAKFKALTAHMKSEGTTDNGNGTRKPRSFTGARQR